MSKNLKLFKKITCILGVAFLLMGMVPLPESAKVTTAAASVAESEQILPYRPYKALAEPDCSTLVSKSEWLLACTNVEQVKSV